MKRLVVLTVLALLLVACGGGGAEKKEEDTGGKTIRPEKEAVNWMIQLRAEDPGRHLVTRNAFLGGLKRVSAAETQSTREGHPASTGGLSIYFGNPEGLPEGRYKRLFYPVSNTTGSWEFTVESTDPDAQIRLGWVGLYVMKPYRDEADRMRFRLRRSPSNPLFGRMKLVDLENGEEIPAVIDGKTPVYSFSMRGETQRRFRWILMEETVKVDEEKKVELMRKTGSVSRKKFRGSPSATPADESFNLNRPPLMEQNR